MPYGISNKQSDCGGWAAVFAEPDGSWTVIGCHESKQDAIEQMVAASISEGTDPLGSIDPEENSAKREGCMCHCACCCECEEDDEDEMEDDLESEDEGEIEEPDETGMEMESREMPSLVAPSFMASAARRGLKLYEQGEGGDGLRPATINDARKMAAGTALSESKWRRIGPWIARHIVDLDAVEGDEITPGLVAMLLWGGGPSKSAARRAQNYAERLVEQIDAETEAARSASIATMIDEETRTTDAEYRWCAVGSDERRIAYTTLEARQIDEKSPTLVGYAAVFDSPSEPMGFTEYVRRGAFAKTIKDGADVRLLIDHEGVPLARTKSGTLALAEDERGLRVEAQLDPSNPDAARVISALRRGDVSQMSFAFRTIKDSWNNDRTIRELREVQLFDVSVVTFPAYEATVAELRAKSDVATIAPTTSLSVRRAQIALSRHR